MKHTKKTLGTMLLSVAVLTSCADMDPLGFNAFEKPANIEGMEYLADYDALKEYKSLNSSVSPDFKLGMALSANDYNANGMWTRLANANFDEVVAGNEMKMASIVNDQGKMDFGTVSAFVTNAETNGMNVYGHTLAWHAQQPVKWLNTILADKELDVDPGVLIPVEDAKFDFADYTTYPFYNVALGDHHFSDGCLVIDPMAATGANWERQYFVADWFSLKEGTSYMVTARIKGSEPGYADVVFGTWGASANGKIEFTDEWQEVTTTIKAAGDANADAHAMFQTGLFTGTIYIDWVTISHGEAPAVEVEQEVYAQDWKKATEYAMWHGGAVDGHTAITADGLEIDSYSTPNFWDFQYFVADGINVKGGSEYVLRLDLKGNPASTNLHYVIGAWGTDIKTGTISFDENWQSKAIPFSYDSDVSGVHVMLQSGDYVGKYYVGSANVFEKVKMNTIPLTPQERKDTLTWAMEQWVAGMMDACGGKVKAWDVVNEAISGGDPDAEGVYALQHDPDGTKPNDFYWQDENKLGDLDYVRTVVKFARQYGPEDIKLFVNDYNLESDWDDNQKLKSLIAWIKRWEADGVTKIDGIGTQMHVSYYSNPEIQASKEKHIVEMFKLMAASGKLVRVSELDIEFKDEQGNNVVVENMTDAQLRKVSDFYKWIIQQYIANVPAAQQYGFCIWTAVDADPSTSWTHNQLYGLWDKNFNRTHAYAGFADGLGGE